MRKAILVAIVFVFVFFLSIETFARIGLGISPSIVMGVELEEGDRTSIRFTVKNFADQETLRERFGSGWENYEFSIKIAVVDDDRGFDTSKMTEDEINTLIPSNWVTFDKTELLIGPEEIAEFTAYIQVPKGVETGEHRLVIQVKQNEEDSRAFEEASGMPNVGTVVLPSVNIPAYIGVGEVGGEKYSLKDDPNPVLFDFTTEDTVARRQILQLIGDALNVFDPNWRIGINRLLYMPFKFEYRGNLYYDIPTIRYKTLRDAIVKDVNELTDAEYIFVDRKIDSPIDTEELLAQMDFGVGGGKFIVYTDKNAYIFDVLDENLAEDIRNQLEFLRSGQSETLMWFLDNIKVPVNRFQANLEIYITVYVTNQKQRAIMPEGFVKVYNASNREVGSYDFSSALIRAGAERQLRATVLYDPGRFPTGRYLMRSSLKPYRDAEQINKNFYIDIINIRIFIIIATLLIFILIVVGIILFLRYLVKLLFRSIKARKEVMDIKSEEQEQEHKEEQEHEKPEGHEQEHENAKEEQEGAEEQEEAKEQEEQEEAKEEEEQEEEKEAKVEEEKEAKVEEEKEAKVEEEAKEQEEAKKEQKKYTKGSTTTKNTKKNPKRRNGKDEKNSNIESMKHEYMKQEGENLQQKENKNKNQKNKSQKSKNQKNKNMSKKKKKKGKKK